MQAAITIFCTLEDGEAHLPTEGFGDKEHCLLLLEGRHVNTVPNPKSTSLSSCGSEFICSWRTQLLSSSQDLPFPCLVWFLCKQPAERKEGTHTATQKAKASSFWQRKVTLTKYFANHLPANCYPRLKKRHITTLKIVCSTAQPWKALARVRAVKHLFQNCQRDKQSLECITRGALMKREEKNLTEHQPKPLLSSRREPRRKLIFQNHLYLHQYLEKITMNLHY